MLSKFNQFIEKWMALVTPVPSFWCAFSGCREAWAALCFPGVCLYDLHGSSEIGFSRYGPGAEVAFSLLACLGVLHVLLPVLACGLGHLLFPGNDDLITGMVLEFSVPTAVVGLMWVTIYGGNSPLSLSLVIADTLLAPFLIPATLQLLVGSRVSMDAAGMMRELLFMIAIPALAAMSLNELTHGRVRKEWPSKLAPFSKMCLIFVVTSNSSKVAPYVRDLTPQRVLVAAAILLLAASGYAIGWFLSRFFGGDRETAVSMIYGSGMRNISAGAVIAAAYFPGEVLFPVMIGTLFQQVLAACYGKLIERKYH